jgi:hypothetical protein
LSTLAGHAEAAAADKTPVTSALSSNVRSMPAASAMAADEQHLDTH